MVKKIRFEEFVKSVKLLAVFSTVFMFYLVLYFFVFTENVSSKNIVSNVPTNVRNRSIEQVENISSKKENIYKIDKVLSVPCTNEERVMFEYVVEAEAHDLSYKHKQIIACVVVNRMYSKLFPYHTVEEVVKARNQFPSIYNYYNKNFTPNEDTKKAVSDVLYGRIDRESVAKGAIFFYNPSICGWNSFFENRELVLEMDGHRFFK